MSGCERVEPRPAVSRVAPEKLGQLGGGEHGGRLVLDVVVKLRVGREQERASPQGPQFSDQAGTSASQLGCPGEVRRFVSSAAMPQSGLGHRRVRGRPVSDHLHVGLLHCSNEFASTHMEGL